MTILEQVRDDAAGTFHRFQVKLKRFLKSQISRAKSFLTETQIVVQSPVTILFVALTVVVFISTLGGNAFVQSFAAMPLFSGVSQFSFFVRLLTYPLAHSSISHLTSNISLILLLGPVTEERLGRQTFGGLLLATAVIGGLANSLLSSNGIIGASGIVFMLITLTPLTYSRSSKVTNQLPVTFLLLFVLYVGKELALVLNNDGVSHLGHLVGGVLGALVGLVLRNGDFAFNAKGPSSEHKVVRTSTDVSQTSSFGGSASPLSQRAHTLKR